MSHYKDLVIASIQHDRVVYFITAQHEWIPFEQMASKYPLEKLQEMGEQLEDQ